MKRPTSLPDQLGQRFTRLALVATGLALFCAGSVTNVATYMMDRQSLQDEGVAQARVIGANIASALLSSDASAAAQTLSALERAPRVDEATLRGQDGQIVAWYRRVQGEARSSPSGLLHHLPGSRLSVIEPVLSQGTAIGEIELSMPVQPSYRRVASFALVTLGAGGLAMLVAYLLARGVRREVSCLEHRLDRLAHRDPVTGLFNRHAMLVHLVAATTRPAAEEDFSVITLGLDDFKVVNDNLGHNGGDDVLREVARRLTSVLPPSAQAYRFGGDEFVVVCSCPQGYREPTLFGTAVHTALKGLHRTDGVELMLTGSVGIARFPIDGAIAEEVLLASDIAMNAAKAAGKNGIVVFHESMRAASRQRLQVESELRAGIRGGQLRLLYQPVVDARDGCLRGAEALVRWQHPQRGLLAPAEFIGVAEASGLIVEVGGWVLAEAARQLGRWEAGGMRGLNVAVNVSALQLREGVLDIQYRSAVAEIDCAARQLELEITEHTLVDDVEGNLRALRDLRASGVHVAVDDFGTGQSSLAYLKRLPVDKLKLDRSFINDLSHDQGDKAIVGAAIQMAHAMGLRVVAEGIETLAQLEVLRHLGCDLIQGYLFGRPMDPLAFERWAVQRGSASSS